MFSLRSKVIRLAHRQPALRPHLLPLLKVSALTGLPGALIKWVKSRPADVKKIRDILQDSMDDVAEGILSSNRYTPPSLLKPKVRGKKVLTQEPPVPSPKIDLTPEAVIARVFMRDRDYLYYLTRGKDFEGWFVGYLEGVFENTMLNPGVVDQNNIKVEDGKLIWMATLTGEQLDGDVEVPDRTEENTIEKVLTKLGARDVRSNWMIEYVRDYGAYGYNYVRYRTHATWDLPQGDIARELFSGDLVKMAEIAIQKAVSQG